MIEANTTREYFDALIARQLPLRRCPLQRDMAMGGRIATARCVSARTVRRSRRGLAWRTIARIDDIVGSLRWYASSPGAERGSCARCGSSLFFRSERWPGEFHIALAHLEGDADRAPTAHVFWDTHVNWSMLNPNDGLPRKPAAESN